MVILFDMYNLPEDVFEIIFSTKQQAIVAKQLVKEFKLHGNIMTKTEMSLFATQLHDGEYIAELEEPPYFGKKVKLSYNKRQFYDRILTPMKSMGLIYYDLYKKTYSLSDKFSKMMQKVGVQWTLELKKPLGTPIKKQP
ncbi:MAG TPA: hypothetical protein ENN46_03575 [Candidatus Woesearchaeota archaeon]|nr:hypothetical protein [Candidatus Woesearchaeota archaeon]